MADEPRSEIGPPVRCCDLPPGHKGMHVTDGPDTFGTPMEHTIPGEYFGSSGGPDV